MKTNSLIRIIIPSILLLGTASAFLVTALSAPPVNASINELNSPTSLASDMFLHIEGIDGESKDANHQNWIEVLSYSHNIQGSYDVSTGRATGVVKHSPLRITKTVDKATPIITQKCAIGASIPAVTLEFWSGGSSSHKFLMIELQNVIITSVQSYGLVDDHPTETISFNYEKIQWTYTEYDSAGNPMGDVVSGWITWSGSAV
ncbi:MAG: Hcp family type VI secretion system effector [Candidatus Thorarchaeota archaeon]